jgi:hypothetical protein
MTASTQKTLPLLRSALLASAFVFAGPASAADFQIEALKLDFGALTVVVPKLDVKGAALERDAFRALLEGKSGETAVARITRLEASEITAPELRFEQKMANQTQVTAYRDVRFSNIRDGRIERGESASGTMSMTGAPTGDMNGSLKRTSFEAFDIKQIARVLTERAPAGANEPMVPVIGRFEQDGYTLDMGAAGNISMGKMSTRGFAAKVGDEPLGEVLTRIIATAETAEKASREADGDKPSFKTAEERRLGLSLLSLYDTISYGSGEARDIAMTVTAPAKPDAKRKGKGSGNGKATAGTETVTVKLSRVAFGEDTPAKSGVALEGLQFSGGGTNGSVESISHSGFSIGPIISELKVLLASPDPDLDSLDYRKFIPTLGTVRFAGVSVDAPQEGKRGQPTPPPVKVGIGKFEFSAGEQLNGVPTRIALAIENLRAPVTEGPENPAAGDLLAMGYKVLDLSARLDLAWEAARNEIAINALSFGGEGMAKFDAKGTLGNVTKDLFASDLALAQVAALGATVRGIEANLQNLGLFEKLIENEARKAKRKPDEVRQQYAMMATLGLSAILGPSDAAKTLTSAISRFIAKPGTLTVKATAKTGSGLGLADVITMSEPTEIFDKIDLEADAE